MEFQGKTVDEAIEAGLTELGVAREDVEITVLEAGKKKLFGSIPAKVEIIVKEKLSDGERAVKFLEGLFPLIGIEAKAVLSSEEEKIVIDLEGAAKGVIGRRGEVIDAVQVLAGAVANTGRKDYKRVVVDCGNYREAREETLRNLALKLAAKAVRTGKRVRLEPMNPYERRIIHSALLESEEVTTRSEGKEPARYVVITPKNMKPYEHRDGRGGKKDGRGRDTRGRGGRGEHGRPMGEKKPYEHRQLPKEDTPESSGTSFSRSGTPGYKKGGFSGFFGTYLGKGEEDVSSPKTENEGTMSETEGAQTPSDEE